MKKYIFYILMIICIFTGCKSKSSPVKNDVIKTETISINQGSDKAYTIRDLTKEELFNMSPTEVESTVTKKIPNWRKIFKVSENHIMSEENWEQIKHLLGYNLWGKEWISWYHNRKEEEDKKNMKETVSENLPSDPDYIYYAPKKSYLTQMDDEEYITYLEGLFEYYGYSPVDFHKLTHEQLMELKKSQIEEVAVPDDYYMEIVDSTYTKPSDSTYEEITVSGDSALEEISVEQIGDNCE